MSGIYTPILAILTLAVLLVQVRLQGGMNEHAFDQSYVQDARADLHFYLEQLVNEVSREFDDGSEIQVTLVAVFAYATLEDMREPKIIEIAKALNKRNHRLVAIWSAIYGILAGLKTNDYQPYSVNYATAKQKAVAMLSYECCAALDNLVWCVSEERLKYANEFSGAFASDPPAA